MFDATIPAPRPETQSAPKSGTTTDVYRLALLAAECGLENVARAVLTPCRI